MPDEETMSAFRSAFRGFNREDVNHYIENFSNRCKSELAELRSAAAAESARKETAQAEAASLREALATAQEKCAALSEENNTLREAAASFAKTEEDYQERIRTLGKTLMVCQSEKEEACAQLEKQGARIVALLKDSEQTPPITPERTTAPGDTLNSRVGDIILSANGTGAEIVEKAKREAALIVSRAEREASLLRVRGQAQREELARVLDKEVLLALNAYMDAYTGQINEMLVSISNTYKKFYGENNELCDRLVRERTDDISHIREKVIAALESTASPGMMRGEADR